MCRSELANAVDASGNDYFRELLTQEVLEFKMHIREVDFCTKELLNQSVKLKCQLDGKTFWKSQPRTITEPSPLQIDKEVKLIYEGGEILGFELCKQTCFGTSVVGICKLPLAEALCPDRRTIKITIVANSLGGPRNTLKLGHLYVTVSAMKTSLDSVGGVNALQSLTNDLRLSQNREKLMAYASKTKAHLEKVLANMLGSRECSQNFYTVAEACRQVSKQVRFSPPHFYFYAEEPSYVNVKA